MNPTVSALYICIVAAVLESALAGSGVRQRLGALRMPPYSPSLSVWILIGMIYYFICFIVLRRLLAANPFTLGTFTALALLIIVLVAKLALEHLVFPSPRSYAAWWGHRVWLLNTQET